MKMSETINEISKAISTAQGEMNPASKSTVNPFFKSTYSSLTQIWESVRQPLSKNNVAVFQDTISTQIGISVSTMLTHCSGQWMEFGPLEIPLTKRDAQSVGSAISYAKRYALCAAVGVVSIEEDDDGEKAMSRPTKESSAQPKQPAISQIPIISTAQASEMMSLLALCDGDFMVKVMEHLTNNKIPSIDRMPITFFDPIKKRIQKYLSDESSTEKANDG